MSELNKDSKDKSEKEIPLSVVRLFIHQMSAPLSGIQGHISNIIENRIPENKVKDRLKLIEAMIQITRRQLRSFSLLTNIDDLQGRADFTQKRDIGKFLRNKISSYKEYANVEGIKLIFNHNAQQEYDEPLFQTDFQLLETVIDELIDNAIKYSYSEHDLKMHPNSNREVVLNYELKGDLLAIEITNWGYKIKTDEIKNIFQRGYRGQNSYNCVGSGMGLYISKKCIEAIEGNLNVIAKNDKTVFRIEIKNHLL